MKITQSQQSIINELMNEFTRINSNQPEKKSFNLINARPLSEENLAKRNWEYMSEGDLKAWESLAHEEACGIVEMLRKDLPDAIVQKYGNGNTFYDLPQVLIKHPRTISDHHTEVVSIEVCVHAEYKENEYGHINKFGTKLGYKVRPSAKDWKEHYDTIEEAVQDKVFLDALRTRVIR